MTTAGSSLTNGGQPAAVLILALMATAALAFLAPPLVHQALSAAPPDITLEVSDMTKLRVPSAHAQRVHGAVASQAINCLSNHGAFRAFREWDRDKGKHVWHLLCRYPYDPDTVFDLLVEATEDPGVYSLQTAYLPRGGSLSSILRKMDALFAKAVNPPTGPIEIEWLVPPF
jgi:hypothetical protein